MGMTQKARNPSKCIKSLPATYEMARNPVELTAHNTATKAVMAFCVILP